MLPAGGWERPGGLTGSLCGLFDRRTSRTSSGQHQEPEEAQHHQRQAGRAQQGHQERAEDPRQARPPTTIGDDANDEAVRLAVKRLDMAAAKGVIHPNQAARRKSRLMKKVTAALQPDARTTGGPSRAGERPG